MKKIADNTLAILLGLIVAIMFAQVMFRYTFNNSLSWSEEIAKFIFIWITFLGAALCFRDRKHLGVDFDPGEWISKLVGHAGREFPKGREALRENQTLLGLLEMGDILTDT